MAGGVPVHARALRDRLPRTGVDDPPVRRVRQRPADQRALPDDPRPRWRWPVGCLRHANADGARLRRSEEPRRGRPLRCGDRLRGRHGRALPRHPARRGHHFDDDQRSRRARVLHVPRRRRAPGRGDRQAQRHPADRHLQGVHRAEGVAVRSRAAPQADRRPDGVLRREHPGVQAAQRVRLPHPRGRLDGRAGARLHPCRRVRLHRARALARAGHRPVRPGAELLLRQPPRLLRGDREVPRGPDGSGRAGCATCTARRPRRRSGCGSTPRRPASR